MRNLAHVIRLTFLLAAWHSSAEAAMYAAGASRAVSPWDLNKTWLGGFGEPRKAEGIHDDVMCRAFLLGDGNQTIAIVALDLTAYNSWRINPLRQELQDIDGIPRKNIIICSTHTHAGPDCMGVWGPNQFTTGRHPPYMDWMDRQIVATVREAHSRMEPVRIRLAQASGLGLSVDKRDPQVFDHQISLLQALREDGNAVVTLITYGNHPEVMFNINRQITADFPYYLLRRIEEVFGGTGVYTSGNLGGLISPDTVDYSWGECERIGMTLADRIGTALRAAPLIDHLAIRTQSREVGIPIDNLLYFLMGRLGLLEINDAWLEARDGKVPVDICYWRLGDQAEICNLPGELFPEAGLILKDQMSSPHRFTINLGNEEIGYLVPVEQFEFPADPFNPGNHYEETLSPSAATIPVVFHALYEMIGVPSPTPVYTLTPPPTGSPTPDFSQTPTPEFTASPTPSPTPTATARPSMSLLAGYMDTNLDGGSGGTVTLLAVVLTPWGTAPDRMAFAGSGDEVPHLPGDPAAFGFVGVPVGGGLPPGNVLLGLEYGSAGAAPLLEWPMLRVKE